MYLSSSPSPMTSPSSMTSLSPTTSSPSPMTSCPPPVTSSAPMTFPPKKWKKKTWGGEPLKERCDFLHLYPHQKPSAVESCVAAAEGLASSPALRPVRGQLSLEPTPPHPCCCGVGPALLHANHSLQSQLRNINRALVSSSDHVHLMTFGGNTGLRRQHSPWLLQEL